MAFRTALESLVRDIRYAWRGLAGAPTFTAVVVATLALGIGANTAVFSVVHAMLLRPLPYREADRLCFIWLQSAAGYARSPMSGPDLGDLRAGTRTFEAFGAIWATGTVALSGDGPPEQLRSAFVTADFFDVLGVHPVLGRTFRPEDSAPGAPPTILLGWDLFARRFGADPALIGRQILVNDQSTTVVGVMPRTFRLLLPPDSAVPDRLQVWTPFWPELERGPRGNLFLRVVGRMRPGVTLQQARDDVGAVAGRISAGIGRPRVFTTVALQADGVRDVRLPLLVLFAGVMMLLTIACVNVASLLLARAAARSHETALRAALGASRARLWRQSLVEGLLLAALGAAGGLAASAVCLRLLIVLAPSRLSRIDAAGLDAWVLAFTLAVSVFWGIVFSLAPALTSSREERLVEHRRISAPSLRYRARATLVVLQLSLSLVLLVGAGLLVRGFVAVQHVDPGFQSNRHLTFRLALPESRYGESAATVAAFRDLRQGLGAVPGVTGVGAISHLPYDDLPNWGLRYAPSLPPPHEDTAVADARSVTTGLLETLSVRLVDGRFFADAEPSPVVIVDEMLAARLWPGRRAVGQPLFIGQGAPERRVEVVGVVAHLRLRSLVEDLTPQLFLPYALWPRTPMAFVVRTNRDPAALAADARAAVAAFDVQLPIYDVRPMQEYVADARAIRRFTMQLASVSALAALLLSCLGVYGVLAYAVTLRRQELAVRRALGADARQVVRQLMREGLVLAGMGCAAGLAGALLAGRLLQSQLYIIDSRDPLSYGVALVLITTGAAVACWVPARRATAIEPREALRQE